eukprot:11224549-Lingulodinium_polyedra.AAC.1
MMRGAFLDHARNIMQLSRAVPGVARPRAVRAKGCVSHPPKGPGAAKEVEGARLCTARRAAVKGGGAVACRAADVSFVA